MEADLPQEEPVAGGLPEGAPAGAHLVAEGPVEELDPEQEERAETQQKDAAPGIATAQAATLHLLKLGHRQTTLEVQSTTSLRCPFYRLCPTTAQR